MREGLLLLLCTLPGACVIDRDGGLFHYLLDYLHGEVRLPEDERTCRALQEEADYFGIPYPPSLADHLANEMEALCGRANVELKKVLALPYHHHHHHLGHLAEQQGWGGVGGLDLASLIPVELHPGAAAAAQGARRIPKATAGRWHFSGF